MELSTIKDLYGHELLVGDEQPVREMPNMATAPATPLLLCKPGDDQPNGGRKDKTCCDPSKNVHRGTIDLRAHDCGFISHQHD
jgi:hypothetical protein